MRRSEREITDKNFMYTVLEDAGFLMISMNTGDFPYVFCVNHVVHEGEIYFHCAREGYKIELMNRDPRAGFFTAVDIEVEKTTTRYRSVYGKGILESVEENERKETVLKALAKKYHAPCRFPLTEQDLAETMLVHIRVGGMTCKYSRPGEGKRPVPHYEY